MFYHGTNNKTKQKKHINTGYQLCISGYVHGIASFDTSYDFNLLSYIDLASLLDLLCSSFKLIVSVFTIPLF